MHQNKKECNHESVKDLDFEWDADGDLIVTQKCEKCGVKIVEQYSLNNTTVYDSNGKEIEQY